jgi:cobalt/nickel transport system permease protein
MSFADRLELGKMDELGRMDTPAHRLDARAKALVTLAFVVVVMSFPRHALTSLTPLLLYPVALIALGRIPAGYIARKILIAAPFALIVGIFNPLVDRQPVAALGPLVISGGWISFASILARFVLTVGAALALVACTGMNRLGAALERLGVPRVFVVQLLFLHRYLFVISDQAGAMMRSAELRSSGRALPLRVYGSMVGHLLLRAMDRADRIYRAMVSRGFDGEVRVLHPTAFRWPDAVFAGICLLFFLAARLWNLAGGLGRLLTGGAG